jgi:hypothetical protein
MYKGHDSELQQYINTRLRELAEDYVATASYGPHDQTILVSLNGRARALRELALHFTINVDIPDCFKGD